MEAWMILAVASVSASVGCVSLAPPAEAPWSMNGFVSPTGDGITRASFELACPLNQLVVTELGEGTIGASGCGKRAVYKWVLHVGWVNNTGVQETPGAS
jgi:hypothetical protein